MAIAGKSHDELCLSIGKHSNLQKGSISPSMPTTKKITKARAEAQSRLPRRKSNGISRGRGPYSGGKSRFLSGSERCNARVTLLPFTSYAIYYIIPFAFWRKWCNSFSYFFHITSYHMEVIFSSAVRAKHGVCWRNSFVSM